MAFEYIVHTIQWWLRKKGREGLSKVFERMVFEIALLGLVTLILLLFEDYALSVCAKFSDSAIKWTMLGGIDGCPCCLSKTEHVSMCAQIYHECAFNASSQKPYCGCDLGWPESTYSQPISEDTECTDFRTLESEFRASLVTDSLQQLNELGENVSASAIKEIASILESNENLRNLTCNPSKDLPGRRLMQEIEAGFNDGMNNTHVIPELGDFTCEGPFYSTDCSPGYYQVLSKESIHQVHLLMFLVASIHIVTSLIVILLAEIRVTQWRRWQESAKQIVGFDRKFSVKIRHTTELIRQSMNAAIEASEVRADSAGSEADHVADEEGNGSIDETVATASSGLGIEDNPDSNASNELESNNIAKAAKELGKKLKKHWGERDSFVQRKQHLLLESVVCVTRAFMPNLVTREQFLAMYKSYVVSLNLPNDFDLVKELQIHLDFDMVRIVGASITSWGILLLQWLLTGIWPWATWLFQCVAMLILLAINIGLVSYIRYYTRGGSAHRLGQDSRRFFNSRNLSFPIAGIIFLTSSVFSVSIFFIWQYGVDSCIFSGGDTLWRITPESIFWAAGYISSGVMLIWLAAVTVPAWVLVMHMRPPDIQPDEESTDAGISEPEESSEDFGQRRQKFKKFKTQSFLLGEIERLNQELHAMQS